MSAPEDHRKLIAFYAGEAPDTSGRWLAGIQQWPDDLLESVHDFIQWMFPLPERSSFSPRAPVLAPETVREFHARPELRGNLRVSLERMLRFYGLEFEPDGRVRCAAEFPSRSRNWLSPSNHNHLRLTRIIRSLRLLGLEPEARALFDCLAEVYEQQPHRITKETLRFWRAAATDPLP